MTRLLCSQWAWRYVLTQLEFHDSRELHSEMLRSTYGDLGLRHARREACKRLSIDLQAPQRPGKPASAPCGVTFV